MGSGLFWAWMDCYYLSAFFPNRSGEEQFFASPFFAVAGVALFSCIVFVTIIVLSRTARSRELVDRFFSFRSSPIACALITTAGSLILVLGNSSFNNFATVIGVFLTGIGSGFFFFFWGREYGRDGARSASIAVPLAFVCAIIIDTPLLSMLPVPRAIFFSLLPILSSLFLVFGKTQHTDETNKTGLSLETKQATALAINTTLLTSGRSKLLFNIPLFILIGALLFTFAHGYMQYLTLFAPVAEPDTGVFFQYTRGFAALALFAGVFFLYSRGIQIYRIGFVVAIGGFLFIPLSTISGDFHFLVLSGMIVTAGYTWFDSFIWSLCCELSNFRGRAEWRTLALMRIVFSIGQVLGFAIAYFTVSRDGFGQQLGLRTDDLPA